MTSQSKQLPFPEWWQSLVPHNRRLLTLNHQRSFVKQHHRLLLQSMDKVISNMQSTV
jgi:hypothetical protein